MPPPPPLFPPASGEPNISWIDGKNGYATVAMTKYYDVTEEPTLPTNLGTHSIYFYAE